MVSKVHRGDRLADIMYRTAKDELHWEEQRAQEMFILGALCETAESFSENHAIAPIMLAKSLENSGYKYWREIYSLALEADGYHSPEYSLLKKCLGDELNG